MPTKHTEGLGGAAAALALAALLLAGCGSEDPASDADDTTTSAEVTGPSAPAGDDTDQTGQPGQTEQPGETSDGGPQTGGPHTPAPDAAVALHADAIGKTGLPASPGDLLAVLPPLLGDPSADRELPGCVPDVADGGVLRSLSWGDFAIHGMAPDVPALRMTSWEVTGEDLPEGLSLPEGLAIGMSEADATALLPDAEVVGPDGVPHGGKMLTEGDLTVKLDGDDGTVISVAAHLDQVACD